MIHFYLQMQRKKDHALTKYPDELWAQYDNVQMMKFLQDEVDELGAALVRRDLTGTHGILVEAVDVAMVAWRITREMKRRLG